MLTPENAISRLELAKQLHVEPRTVDRWVRSGVNGVRLRKRYIGGRVYFDPADVAAWQTATGAVREAAPAESRSRRRRSEGSEAAKQRLRERGIKF